ISKDKCHFNITKQCFYALPI
ncbi:DUF1076 domain-containing protein, partial [Escherichia coli]